MRNWLFVCSRNRLRSPTAEAMFGTLPGTETMSAGTSPDADNPLSGELIEWADTIFVMERVHRTRVQRRFRRHLNGKRVICLDIPDDYAAMDPALMALLTKRMAQFL
ncbi:phosphotyrosine protein phosphatase [Sphingomonas sp. 2R-10]|uniref:low molecular weight protein tyrosine phosphatase family protein n=1 Tax=Sphingomonas sp. 2R-10 TaxID=3045148 RepID=UPI000F795D38|nr:phosphotyrosine protein phosphatase [Sphingomonas sp. 2R-10]MDJ0275827.1 phosphotyrosine protein phosphatase [Sphingomonas sp. 2R-10]